MGESKWKWVWNLNISAKVQMFVWRVLKGILPTNVNLITRYVNVEPVCMGCGPCGGDYETVEHVLLECPRIMERESVVCCEMKRIYAQMLPEVLSVDVTILLGVRCAMEKGVTRIEVEMDSQTVYYALMRNMVDLSHFGGLVLDINKACQVFDVSFNWVRRSGNRVAHCLSRFAFGCTLLYFSSSIPETIVNVVNADISGI